MKRLIIFLLLCLIFSLPVSAENQNEFYEEQFRQSHLEDAAESLPKETKNTLENFGISADNPNFTKSITYSNLFSMINDFLKNGFKEPFSVFRRIAIICILFALFKTFSDIRTGVGQAVDLAFSASLCVVTVIPMIEKIGVCTNAIKAAGVFMLSFLPAFFGVVTASGKSATASGSSGLLLLAAEITVNFAAFYIVPFVTAYLALGVTSAVSPLIKSGVPDSVKKAVTVTVSCVFSLFVGVLSIQSTITSAADSVSVKTLKFMVGTFVPIAGSALSDAVGTVGGSMQLLRQGVGIYAVVALAAILLPVIFELLFWRLIFLLSDSLCELLEISAPRVVVKSLDSAISVIITLLLFIGALFIISLSIIMH